MKTMHIKLWCLSAMLFCVNLMAAEPATDQAFFEEVYAGNTFEIQAGTIASKAVTPEVVNYAKMMVTDHGKAKKELEDLAAKKKWALPTKFPDKHQELLNRFSGEEGVVFDRDYVKTMGEDHQTDAAKIKQAIPGIADSNLKSWAESYLKVVNKHEKAVEALGFK